MSHALQAIKRFRLHELNGLRSHIQRFGPLQSSLNRDPSQLSIARPNLPNPFLPRLNPRTGHWCPPKYSLRRQAELIKAAKACGVVHLLPPGPKLLHPERFLPTKSDPQTVPPYGEGVSAETSWAASVRWDGEIKAKAGADQEASRLYTGRKRMFKGHKWERLIESRIERRKVLMSDMTKRVMRFKQYHRKRRPNPLKPGRSVTTKLPF